MTRCFKCGHQPRRRKKQTYQPTKSEEAWAVVVFVVGALLFFYAMAG